MAFLPLCVMFIVWLNMGSTNIPGIGKIGNIGKMVKKKNILAQMEIFLELVKRELKMNTT